jgi:hypothetical protein
MFSMKVFGAETPCLAALRKGSKQNPFREAAPGNRSLRTIYLQPRAKFRSTVGGAVFENHRARARARESNAIRVPIVIRPASARHGRSRFPQDPDVIRAEITVTSLLVSSAF